MTPPGPAAATPHAGPPEPASGARFAAVLLVTIVSAAVALRVADAVPGWWRGEPRGVREYATLDALEADLRTRLLLPAYFPDVLQWPPSRVALSAGGGQPTLVEFSDRRDGRIRVVLCQTVRGDFRVPARLLPAGMPTLRGTVAVDETPATLARGTTAGGEAWTELSWVVQERRVVMRVIGKDLDPLRLARSLHRRRP